MRLIAAAALISIVASGCNEDSPISPGQGAATIVAFGDSLTSGPRLRPDQTYPALLQERIAREGLPYRVRLLSTGEADMIVSTFTITEQRKQQVDFAGPYFVAHQE